MPHYAMVIEWSDEDQAFIVTVPELPGARSHGDTYREVTAEGERLIEEWIAIAQDRGWPLPQPRTFAATA